MGTYKAGDVLGALGAPPAAASDLFSRPAPIAAVDVIEAPSKKKQEEPGQGKKRKKSKVVKDTNKERLKLSKQIEDEEAEKDAAKKKKRQEAAEKKDVMVVATPELAAQRRSQKEAGTVVVKKKQEEEVDLSDEEAPPAKKSKFDPASEAEKLTRTVFVGNLPKSTTRKELARFFTEYGAVESARLRSVPTAGVKVDEAGNQDLVKKVSAFKSALSDVKATVNGYVVFKLVSAVSKAIEEGNGKCFDKEDETSNHLRVDRAVAERDATEHLRTAFVGNLPRTTSEEGLRLFFASHIDEDSEAAHAAITNVRLVRDRETYESKGVAYVVFSARMSLVKALELDGSDYTEANSKARPLRVKTCGKRAPAPQNKQRAKKGAPDKRPTNAKRRIDSREQPKPKKPRHRDDPDKQKKEQRPVAKEANKPAASKPSSEKKKKKKPSNKAATKAKADAPAFQGRQAATPPAN